MRLTLSLSLLIALLTPTAVGATKPGAIDPAVAHANSIMTGSETYREGWFGSGETKLHYVEVGRGPLVILYHGFPSFWYSWFDQMEALKSNYHVVAVDGLGANFSAKPTALAPYRVKAMARQLDGLARHINGNKRFVLVGHDWGAALAFAYAQAYPKRVYGVAGISAPPYNLFLELAKTDPEQRSRSAYMQAFRALTLADIESRGFHNRVFESAYRALIDTGALSAAEVDLFRSAVANPRTINGGMNWYRANMPPFDAIAEADFWPKRKLALPMPTILIWGNADRSFVPAFIDRFQTAVPHAQITRIDGVEHWATMESDPTTTAALARFVASTAR